MSEWKPTPLTPAEIEESRESFGWNEGLARRRIMTIDALRAEVERLKGELARVREALPAITVAEAYLFTDDCGCGPDGHVCGKPRVLAALAAIRAALAPAPSPVINEPCSLCGGSGADPEDDTCACPKCHETGIQPIAPGAAESADRIVKRVMRSISWTCPACGSCAWETEKGCSTVFCADCGAEDNRAAPAAEPAAPTADHLAGRAAVLLNAGAPKKQIGNAINDFLDAADDEDARSEPAREGKK